MERTRLPRVLEGDDAEMKAMQAYMDGLGLSEPSSDEVSGLRSDGSEPDERQLRVGGATAPSDTAQRGRPSFVLASKVLGTEAMDAAKLTQGGVITSVKIHKVADRLGVMMASPLPPRAIFFPGRRRTSLPPLDRRQARRLSLPVIGTSSVTGAGQARRHSLPAMHSLPVMSLSGAGSR